MMMMPISDNVGIIMKRERGAVRIDGMIVIMMMRMEGDRGIALIVAMEGKHLIEIPIIKIIMAPDHMTGERVTMPWTLVSTIVIVTRETGETTMAEGQKTHTDVNCLIINHQLISLQLLTMHMVEVVQA